MKRIVYTRHDGGVSICTPTPWIMSVMENGGLWNDRPRGFADSQIERMVGRGVHESAAHRYVGAVQSGGCTRAETLEIIRDRDCAHLGTAHEVWDLSDIPADRWFRDAWRRSHNGGPIGLSLPIARKLQMRHIRTAVSVANQDDFIEVDFAAVKRAIESATEVEELKRIWPEELHASKFRPLL